MSCCDVNGLNRIFRHNFAERDKRRFLTRGLDKRQRALLNTFQPDGQSVLDIGCGVGALGFSALQQGATYCQFIDVSSAYLSAAKELSEQLRLEDKTAFLQGDFVLLESKEADTVLLDRVVCCYPDALSLLTKAAAQSRETLSFSYPLSRWWMRLARTSLNGVMALLGNPYRFYVHDEASLLRAAVSAGHKLVDTKRYGLWQVRSFRKA